MSLQPSMRIATNLVRSRAGGNYVFTLARRSYSDEASSSSPASPPLLQKLKADLKTAMRAKDAARLTVLRGVLAATLNASKTASPITTDVALVSLIRRHARNCAEARAEALAAGREDLAAKEEAQIHVLNQYVAISGLEEVDGERLAAIVRDAIAGMGGEQKPRMGDVMKVLLAPGGPLEGQSFEKGELARIVKSLSTA